MRFDLLFHRRIKLLLSEEASVVQIERHRTRLRKYGLSVEKNEREKSEGRLRLCVSPLDAIVTYLNSLDVNYTSGNNVYVLSPARDRICWSANRESHFFLRLP